MGSFSAKCINAIALKAPGCRKSGVGFGVGVNIGVWRK